MKLIIIGAGFGGLQLANKLRDIEGLDILLIDQFNYHQFQPLFYQVATAGLDASNISFPLRKVFQHCKNVRIRKTEVLQIKAEHKTIITADGEMVYDILVIATGAGNNFFGNDQIQQQAFAMKSTVEALQIRHHLLQCFENALYLKEDHLLQKMLNVVVVGAGATGVEISGAIADMKKYVLPKDYPELDFSKMNIYLLEGGNRVLAAMSEAASDDAKRYLDKLGVTVMTGTIVKDYQEQLVTLQNGDTLPAATLIWAAGIKGNIPEGMDSSFIVKGNRIKVDRYNSVMGMHNIYAIGDVCSMETPLYANGHPQVASVAIQQARLLARNIKAQLKGKAITPFEYQDKGAMATVGRNLAVVDIPKPKWHFGGFFAWLVWMSLHLMLILGVKNRFFVFVNWLYNYITYDQSLRLIFHEFDRKKKT